MRKGVWQRRWVDFVETVSSTHFWLTLLGLLVVFLLWLYLFSLALEYDVRLPMHATFCSSDEERDRHILAIVLTIPFFLMGMFGVTSEWMTIMKNRRAGRKNTFKSLLVFFVLLQVSAFIILSAMQC